VQEILRAVVTSEPATALVEYQTHKELQRQQGCMATSSKHALPLPSVDHNPSRLEPSTLPSSVTPIIPTAIEPSSTAVLQPIPFYAPFIARQAQPLTSIATVPRLGPQRPSQGHFSGSRHSQPSKTATQHSIPSPYHGEFTTLEAPPSHCTGLVSVGFLAHGELGSTKAHCDQSCSGLALAD